MCLFFGIIFKLFVVLFMLSIVVVFVMGVVVCWCFDVNFFDYVNVCEFECMVVVVQGVEVVYMQYGNWDFLCNDCMVWFCLLCCEGVWACVNGMGGDCFDLLLGYCFDLLLFGLDCGMDRDMLLFGLFFVGSMLLYLFGELFVLYLLIWLFDVQCNVIIGDGLLFGLNV